MNIEKQINRKVKDNKASIIVNLFAIIPVYFLGVVFFTTLLMSTSEIEHICNRLEPNHVECYPGTLLVD